MEPGQREQGQESMEGFKARVKERTGMDFDSIPKGERGDAVRHIMLKRGDLIVVGYDDHPDQDPETGETIFKEFRVVDLSE